MTRAKDNALHELASAFSRMATCWMKRITYDFVDNRGEVVTPFGLHGLRDSSDLIRMFEAIDNKVKRIDTFVGDRRDLVFIRKSGEWQSYAPDQVKE